MKQASIMARVKKVIQADGLQFKDLNGNGICDPYEDWRLSAEQRAENLVSQMTIDEKIGLMVISSRPMGISQSDTSKTSHAGVLDESMFVNQHAGGVQTEGTTGVIEKMHIRHFIIREVPKAGHIATWINAMNEVAEGTRLGIPVIVASNSRNERGGFKLHPKKDDQDFTQWPGTLGLAATKNLELIAEFAAMSRQEFDAAGIKKGYMYMADTLTDPRWFRSYGTFGEHPAFIAEVMACLIKGFQGDELGPGSVAMTTKHFPGGGARENGFDPHYAEGKYNCYATPGSLEAYHLPPFQAAIRAGSASIMPYYAIPSNDKSAIPQAPLTEPFEEIGFAYNSVMIDDLLRKRMGFQGYVNSDSGILTGMAWGVEGLDLPERAARAINAGVDIIADTTDIASIKAAFERGLITEERINLAAKRLTTEMFQLGLFDNPYRDPAQADAIVNCEAHRVAAYAAHQQSVVLLKNTQGLLPLTTEKLKGKKVYVELFEKGLLVSKLDTLRADIKHLNPDIHFTTDFQYADLAILFVHPFTGDYFKATEGLLELNICEATNINIGKIKEIRSVVPQVVMSINFKMAWLLTNAEPLADALLGAFETYETATMDVICGRAQPVGQLPLTLPGSDAAIAVDQHGKCASPNDVPGYDKEKYMQGKAYAYVDAQGNCYRLGFGLRY